jgi:hypothetical protein
MATHSLRQPAGHNNRNRLLIAPAAYHRIHEAGDDTERFHRVASRLMLAALVFLGPGMAGDLFLVIANVTHLPAWQVGWQARCYWRSTACGLA